MFQHVHERCFEILISIAETIAERDMVILRIEIDCSINMKKPVLEAWRQGGGPDYSNPSGNLTQVFLVVYKIPLFRFYYYTYGFFVSISAVFRCVWSFSLPSCLFCTRNNRPQGLPQENGTPHLLIDGGSPELRVKRHPPRIRDTGFYTDTADWKFVASRLGLYQ